MVGDHVNLLATETHDVVPDRFLTILRNRERHASSGTADTVATGNQLGLGGIGLGRVIDILRRGGTATALENPQLVVRMSLQKSLQACRQHLLVLTEVLRCNGIQHGIAGIRVRMVHARLIRRRRRGQTTLPDRNGARRIGGTFPTQRREILTQAGSLGSVNFGLGRQAERSQGQYCNMSQHSVLLAAPE